MFNSKIIISPHAKERFKQRGIKFTNNNRSINKQIKIDLSPSSVKEIISLNKKEKKVITRKGKVYIIEEKKGKDIIIVKTIYKINIRDRNLKRLLN